MNKNYFGGNSEFDVRTMFDIEPKQKTDSFRIWHNIQADVNKLFTILNIFFISELEI